MFGLPVSEGKVPVISLADAPGEKAAWGRPAIVVYVWAVFERLFVTNSWQISSAMRTQVLRIFGAQIGKGVVFRPRTRVSFPWKLHIGDNCWIGEGVWFHNQNEVHIAHDAVISQETFITTGSHAHRRDMALITRPVHIGAGAWITSRCVVLGGANIGTSALAKPMTVISGEVPANSVVAGHDCQIVGWRFNQEEPRE